MRHMRVLHICCTPAHLKAEYECAVVPANSQQNQEQTLRCLQAQQHDGRFAATVCVTDAGLKSARQQLDVAAPLACQLLQV